MNAQQLILSLVLATMVFAVALDLKLADFQRVAQAPRAIFAGLFPQFVLLPVGTWLLTLAVDLPPNIEAAMLLVAACPGGNLSNFVTHFGRGNTALSVSLTASKEPRLSNSEEALSLAADLSLSEKHLIGLNVLRGDRDGNRRTLYGVWASLGLSKNAYYLGEFDWQNRDGSSNTASFVTYHRLGYSIVKGFDIYALYERLESDLASASSSIERRGPGVQWTPLPHIEISGSWTKQRLNAPNPMEEDYAWLVLHYWL